MKFFILVGSLFALLLAALFFFGSQKKSSAEHLIRLSKVKELTLTASNLREAEWLYQCETGGASNFIIKQVAVSCSCIKVEASKNTFPTLKIQAQLDGARQTNLIVETEDVTSKKITRHALRIRTWVPPPASQIWIPSNVINLGVNLFGREIVWEGVIYGNLEALKEIKVINNNPYINVTLADQISVIKESCFYSRNFKLCVTQNRPQKTDGSAVFAIQAPKSEAQDLYLNWVDEQEMRISPSAIFMNGKMQKDARIILSGDSNVELISENPDISLTIKDQSWNGKMQEFSVNIKLNLKSSKKKTIPDRILFRDKKSLDIFGWIDVYL